MKILADASLPNLSLCFSEPFHLTRYHDHKELKGLLPEADVLLCRSTLHVNATLLEKSKIQCVGTASSGIDHIDIDYLSSRQIKLFDAKGCNAHAVADYVMATLAWLEKNMRLNGKKAGVIGHGAVGSLVSQRLKATGYEVLIYDPYQATGNDSPYYCHFKNLTECDFICIHPNLHHNAPYPSQNLINTDFLSQLKKGTALINASRGGILVEKDLMAQGERLIYCTDVYCNEPQIDEDVIQFATLCTPHIAGHTIEAKNNAVIQLSEQIYTHFHLSPIIQRVRPLSTWNSTQTWQESILSQYNPYDQTQALQTATHKKEAFLSLRQNHIRHDLRCF